MPKQIPGVPRGAPPLYPQQPELFYPEARAPSGAQYDAQYSAGESQCFLIYKYELINVKIYCKVHRTKRSVIVF